MKRRYMGYVNAIERSSGNVNNDLIYFGDFTFSTGICAVKSILSKTQFDGLVCGNDLIAAGAIYELYKSNYVIPDDVKVIGFDNIYFSRFLNPPLTTIAQPTYDIGYRAAEILLGHLIDHQELQEVHLDYEIVMRGTV